MKDVLLNLKLDTLEDSSTRISQFQLDTPWLQVNLRYFSIINIFRIKLQILKLLKSHSTQEAKHSQIWNYGCHLLRIWRPSKQLTFILELGYSNRLMSARVEAQMNHSRLLVLPLLMVKKLLPSCRMNLTALLYLSRLLSSQQQANGWIRHATESGYPKLILQLTSQF